MAQRKKKQDNDYQDHDYYDVLKGKVPVNVHELIKMIHRINPTGEDTSPQESSQRYTIKTQLQSLLIRRFHESLIVEQPEPENPRLIGLRLRHFDKDACHAIIDELDEDARGWAQRQIDEALTCHSFESAEISKKSIHNKFIGTDEYSSDHGIKENRKNLTKSELLTLGQNALAEYDYEACEEYYLGALKVCGDDPAPASFLLELYVDYLAAYGKAVDLSNTIPIGVKANEKMKILSALAAARIGLIDSALAYIKGVSHPRVGEVYVLSIKHLIQEGDPDRALRLLMELASFEQVELRPEIEQLAKSIQLLRDKDLEPIEQEMILAQQQGRTEDSLKLADRILSVSPENKAARRIRHEFKKQQRNEEINRLLSLADEAKRNNDFSREAELLNKAVASGANAESLAKRLELARIEANCRKEAMEIECVINLLAEGNEKKALFQYIDLNTPQRSRIQDKIHNPHFAWLDQILSTQTVLKPEKLVEAVLVLGRSKQALKNTKEPERIIAEMEPHGKALQSVPEAHDILKQAEMLLQAAKCQEAKDLLDNAACFLERKDTQKASACMDQVKVNLLQEDDKRFFDDLNHRLHYLEKFMRLKQSYIDSHAREDHFAARGMAAELAGYTAEDTSGYWLDRVEEHTSRIKKEWSLISINVEGLPVPFAFLGLKRITGNSYGCLLPEERHFIIATSQERWIFLRIFDLDDQKFIKVIILRTPKQIHLQNIYPVGKVLWITGERGEVLEIGLEPLNILSWHDYSSLAREEEVIEGAWLFPKSRALWLEKRQTKSNFSEIEEIIDIDQHCTVRQAKSSGYPIIINTGGHFRVAIQNLTTKTVQMYSERGKPAESFTFKNYQTIDIATSHPNGKDFIFFPFDDSGGGLSPFQNSDDDRGDLVIQMEVRPDLQGKYKPLRIENTCGELQHMVFTSFEKGIIFIFYADNFSNDSKYLLAAFKDNGQGFDQLYEVKVPGEIVLACDEFSRQVAAISFQGSRAQGVILDENPPIFEFEIRNSFEKKSLPEFRFDYYSCNNPKDSLNAATLAFMGLIKNFTGKELQESIKKMKQPGNNSPDEIAAFMYALYRTFRFEEANDMKMWMRTQHPDHFIALQDMAEEAAKEKNWPQVISLLERISLSDLNDGNSRHICHLLGIAYFLQGEIKRAQDIWMEGMTYENGECDLNPYIEYAAFSLLPAKERRKNDLAAAFSIYESVDNLLAHKKWGEAIEALERNGVVLKTDLQILARRTWAYLNQNLTPGKIQWLGKIAILANYCEVYDYKHIFETKVLPPYIETWPESRLSDIARQAKQWLDEL